MDKMKAFARTNQSNLEVKLIEVQIPSIEENEVLVEVAAFGVGLHDRFFIPQDASFPYPIGTEGTGKIVKVGQEATNSKVTDAVILSSSMQPKGGCWAKYVAVSKDSIITLPDEMDVTTGASLPVAGKTALEVIRAVELSKGDTLFISGASGAIGSLAIQLATNKGVRVAASASTKNHDHMKSLGCEYTVDYKASDWKKDVDSWAEGGVDAAIAILPGTVENTLDVVRDGGKLVTVSGDDQVASERGIKVEQFIHKLDFRQAMNELTQLIVDNKVKVIIDHIYSFDEAVKALEKTETHHARGKSVVLI